MNESKTYSAKVLEICDNGDAIIELPPELCKDMDWKEGTVLNLEMKDGVLYMEEVKNKKEN